MIFNYVRFSPVWVFTCIYEIMVFLVIWKHEKG